MSTPVALMNAGTPVPVLLAKIENQRIEIKNLQGCIEHYLDRLVERGALIRCVNKMLKKGYMNCALSLLSNQKRDHDGVKILQEIARAER